MKPYFCGWYFKCQSPQQTLAVIPSIHRTPEGTRCWLQLITRQGAWHVPLPAESFRWSDHPLDVTAGGNHFSSTGLSLAVEQPDCQAHGSLSFGPLTPLRYDIMGPFRYVPGLECRHSVVSMRHTVTGCLQINGQDFCFDASPGYIEGDRGSSFPSAYVWSQCFWPGGSLMLSVARVPVGPAAFTGVIAVVRTPDQEYRMASYLGARAVQTEQGKVVIRQGATELTARLLEQPAHSLLAPDQGAMRRRIRESVCCRAVYQLTRHGRTELDFTNGCASFEYEYPR